MNDATAPVCYAAFIPANAIGASGVLAAVTTGLYMGIGGPSVIPARIRLQGTFVWELLDFIVNASLFVLVGVQLHSVVDRLGGISARKARPVCGADASRADQGAARGA